MTEYVDGFVIPVPADKVEAYREIAEKASKIWMEYGAMDYRECVADDIASEGVRPFTAAADAKEGETVIFAWITYKSKEDRDEINAKVMKDPRLNCMGEDGTMPFDCKRMIYGGFKTIVSV